jgi:hypothetical protein
MTELNAPIFTETYNMYRTLHEWRNSIPKGDRYCLWKDVEQTCLQLVKLLLTISHSSNKKLVLEQYSVQLNILRVLLRLAKDTKLIDVKKYATIQEKIDTIGRMLGGWIKAQK